MFTGLIEEIGSVLAVRPSKGGTQLHVAASQLTVDVRAGDSVAVNGCCLTLVAKERDELVFDLLNETLQRTNLQMLRPDDHVNLECALAAGGRLGGHFVQGHIDCTAPVIAFEKRGADFRLEIELPGKFAQYLAVKGSIAINGISLTVAEILPRSFAVWIIPHTKRHTNLDTARAADLVNLEFDLLAKYVERMLGQSAGDS
ncbi:MAG: riboflavin synthase [Chthoniobacterales bacterium]